MTIQRIEALDPESQLPLEGEALTRAFPEGFPAKAVVPGVQSTAVLFAFSVDRVPASLTHHSRFQMGDNPEPLTVEQPGTPVRLNTLRIHPPLSGANWLALNDLGATTITRAASCRARAESTCPSASPSTSYNSNHPAGHITAMQRTTANYHRYGAQALSVAEATVLEVRDGIPENVPDPEKRAVAMTLATVSGNHIVLDLGHGRFPPTPTFSRAPSAPTRATASAWASSSGWWATRATAPSPTFTLRSPTVPKSSAAMACHTSWSPSFTTASACATNCRATGGSSISDYGLPRYLHIIGTITSCHTNSSSNARMGR